jgi:hypothetical protein
MDHPVHDFLFCKVLILLCLIRLSTQYIRSSFAANNAFQNIFPYLLHIDMRIASANREASGAINFITLFDNYFAEKNRFSNLVKEINIGTLARKKMCLSYLLI